MDTINVRMIAAISAQRRALGNNNKLLWHLPNDLKRFKILTDGHHVILGRKTYDSIISYLGKPLPNRTSIVLTRNAAADTDSTIHVSSIKEALQKVSERGLTEVFVIGGAEIYSQALPYTTQLDLTLVKDEPVADTFFPEYEHLFVETERKSVLSADDQPEYAFVTYKLK